MPNLDGLSLAQIVSERWPQIGILLTSGLAVPPELPAGARFISKPYESETLHNEIAAVIAKAAKMPNGAARAAHTSIQSLHPGHPGQVHGAGALAQPLPQPET
jgi:FixJ family two-component response regulator